MLTKRPFDRSTVTYNTERDMGLKGSHDFVFWDDPSKEVVMTLVDTVSMNEERLNALSEEDKKRMDSEWWSALSKVFIDCDIEGVDFSTPESTKASFDSENVSWGYLLDVAFFYVGRLLAENKRLGEILRRIAAR